MRVIAFCSIKLLFIQGTNQDASKCPRGTNPGRTYRFYTGKANTVVVATAVIVAVAVVIELLLFWLLVVVAVAFAAAIAVAMVVTAVVAAGVAVTPLLRLLLDSSC